MMAKVPAQDPESGAQQTDEQLVVQYRTSGSREVFALRVRRFERELYS